jgi:dihydrofolate reductase
MIKVIFATGANGEFGKNGELPWKGMLRGDGQHFRNYTKDCILVMGNATWQSLPKKLPNRKHIVLTRSGVVANVGGEQPDAIMYGSLSNVLAEAQEVFAGDVCVIGGTGLINEALELADSISWTKSPDSFEDCDTFLTPSVIARTIDESGMALVQYETFYKSPPIKAMSGEAVISEGNPLLEESCTIWQYSYLTYD